jgi:hypothetical protein
MRSFVPRPKRIRRTRNMIIEGITAVIVYDSIDGKVDCG